jgi:hypothetical protein
MAAQQSESGRNFTRHYVESPFVIYQKSIRLVSRVCPRRRARMSVLSDKAIPDQPMTSGSGGRANKREPSGRYRLDGAGPRCGNE